jgi:hypothetical protein
MFSKVRNITLAVAAVAAVGAAVLVTSTSSADARGFGGGGFSRGGGHIGGGHIGGGHLGGGRIGGGLQARVPGRVTGFRPGIRIPNRPGIHIGHRWPHHHPNWCRWNHRCGIHVRWYRPWVYGGVAATTYAVAPTVAAAAAPSCTCLKKEYTPDNLVVVSDVCTKEVASAPIGNTQVQLPAPQQGPVQR